MDGNQNSDKNDPKQKLFNCSIECRLRKMYEYNVHTQQTLTQTK